MTDRISALTDALDFYDEALDAFGAVEIGDLTYLASHTLRMVDPIAYRCGFHDYCEAEGIDSDELTGIDPRFDN